MRKILVGAVAGLALIAGQAAAAGGADSLKVGDRLGAAPGSMKYQGQVLGVPTIVWIGGIMVITFVAVANSEDNDSPVSN